MAIYHYTDLNGLKGIIESEALWATNINFLNDKNEYIHGFECFRNTIEYLDDEINGVPVKHLLKQSMEYHVDIHKTQIISNLNTYTRFRFVESLTNSANGEDMGILKEFVWNLMRKS